ncbi:UPF0149 family protein [Ideonella livida]|uniref:UPF0149 family protein n=1 Tax=Ideonella livida TaxID=2707176 RepID=A0A7C9TN44_9BURK|nr:UPF0149 family protein [Ideonella livida]NDY93483.1 UPF0149 family protein [Ideonella livida]
MSAHDALPENTPAQPFWNAAEVEQLLDALLDEDNGLDCPMSPSAIDGFFCALHSAPRAVLPVDALRWIWDAEHGRQEPGFADPQRLDALLTLLLRQWEAIGQALQRGQDYEPLLLEEHAEAGPGRLILDDWCEGYQMAMALDAEAWAPLLVAQPPLFEVLNHFGTESGWEARQTHPPDADALQAAAQALAEDLRRIHAHHRGTGR